MSRFNPLAAGIRVFLEWTRDKHEKKVNTDLIQRTYSSFFSLLTFNNSSVSNVARREGTMALNVGIIKVPTSSNTITPLTFAYNRRYVPRPPMTCKVVPI
jgi:hypothetical protein